MDKKLRHKGCLKLKVEEEGTERQTSRMRRVPLSSDTVGNNDGDNIQIRTGRRGRAGWSKVTAGLNSA